MFLPRITGSGESVLVTDRSVEPITARHWENSEVLPAVAVAVITWPGESEVGKIKLAVQLPSVITVVEPMKVCPSPLPKGSQEAFEKN